MYYPFKVSDRGYSTAERGKGFQRAIGGKRYAEAPSLSRQYIIDDLEEFDLLSLDGFNLPHFSRPPCPPGGQNGDAPSGGAGEVLKNFLKN
jgi:hypothetical protein